MIFVPMTNVHVPENRYRKIFDPVKLKETAESIATCGLINLPVVKRTDREGVYELVAGERRCRAMTQLWSEGRQFKYHHEPVPEFHLPVALWEELDAVHAREVELEENARRTDLSWQEHCAAVQALHEMRKKQDPTWTEAQTTEELIGRPTGSTPVVRDQIILAKNLHRPAVAKAPDAKTAMKVLRKELEVEFAAQYGLTVGYNSTESLIVRLGDCLDLLKEYPDGSFDIVLTDPPYGVGAQNFDAEMVVTHDYDDSWKSVRNLMLQVIPQLTRVTLPQAHLYMFCDLIHFFEFRDILESQLWAVWPRPLIWHKDVGHIPAPNYGPKRTYECILFANKGQKMVTALYDDVIDCPAVKDKTYAAEKPVELLMNLLKRSVGPTSKVLDPFVGSGATLEAAYNLQVKAVGIERNQSAVLLAAQRIKRLG